MPDWGLPLLVRHQRRRPLFVLDHDHDAVFDGELYVLNAACLLWNYPSPSTNTLPNCGCNAGYTRLPCAHILLDPGGLAQNKLPCFLSSGSNMAHRTADAGPSKLKTKSPRVLAEASMDADDMEVDVEVESVDESASEDDESPESEYHDAYSPSPDRKGKGRATSPPFTPSRRPPASESKDSASKARRMSSWADLDLSIIVALVSPIGNWLTGGDHIKNVVLIILLIFYLHQIVESTYHAYARDSNSRPWHTN